ncbi:hypothetical protein BX616_010653 [Lobosporangium transversale]|uniref:Uncharacterized protein n=1 Tax=Lobosporangium transversale TaxID=64571 RepID=A0A1Y2GQD2_9FUNG|nr:hypothetical protein BCR41DRAFT_353206 [Lobosporangium transversale]KAF9911169.1 hypothetical protein BX616_010653 [Lobosporangium transversale]ORZ16804.1 hypothetical protein BCR41DRAFT_353206 [Lobosporangium transversale]|eukprot:XP_021881739.1 hypothetical protein BCR41DRAFT_353206 [Lobosporangium transversale]
MDFYAEAYGRDARSESPLPKNSSHFPHEGVCQGYGSEANAHLRRASSGLEKDMGRHLHGSGHGDSHSNTKNYEQYRSSGLPASGKGNEGFYFSLGATPTERSHQSHQAHHGTDPAKIPSADTSANPTANMNPSANTDADVPTKPSYNRKTSVSNPCLLHHTNTNGSGTVRSPAMPRSLSSSQFSDDEKMNTGSS